MYSWLVGRIVRALIARLNKGDIRPILAGFAPDAHFVFPGRSSFAADHRGKREIEAWFTRFAAFGPKFTIHDVTVAGPPWNARTSIRFTDRMSVAGAGDYENEGMIYQRSRWGRIKEDRVYLDTQRIAELDARLQTAPGSH
jgi:ketosteroid isomerase-like protein